MSKTDNDVGYCVVLTTLNSREDAQTLVRRLVKDRVVACGTIFENALSIYEWQGKLEETQEAVVLLKIRQENWEQLQSVVCKLHPYDVPELLAIPVAGGLPAYLVWLAEQTTQESR